MLDRNFRLTFVCNWQSWDKYRY